MAVLLKYLKLLNSSAPSSVTRRGSAVACCAAPAATASATNAANLEITRSFIIVHNHLESGYKRKIWISAQKNLRAHEPGLQAFAIQVGRPRLPVAHPRI